jgi:hypothetical protein
MRIYDRRHFIAQTVISGAMLSSSVRRFAESAQAGPPVLPKDQESIKNLRITPVEAITQCQLTVKEPGRLFCFDGQRTQTVILSPSIKVWKGAERDNTSDLVAGDILDIRLERGPNGAFNATYIWANVVKYEGIVLSVSSDGMTILAFSPNGRREALTNTRILVRWTSRTIFPTGATASDFRLERAVMIFGRRLPDGSIEASRVVLGDN